MSDCNVCLYADDGAMAEVFTSEHRKARKEYKCYECERPIPAGSTYEYAKMFYEGEWAAYRTCLICEEIRKAFYCDGVMYGEFWSQFADVMDDLSTTCFDRLKTPEAKKYLMERLREHKGLSQ